MADQLADPEDLAALLESDVDTYKATMLIECATAVIQAVTGQRIVQVAGDVVTIDLDPLETSLYLELPERPVTAVTTVLVGATTITGYSTQLSYGRLWRSTGWLSGTSSATGGPSTVTVTYTHGYPTGHQKLQLARSAVLSLVRAVYGNPTGATREQIDDYAVMYAEMAASLETSPFLRDALRRQYGRPRRSARLVTGENVLWPV